LIRCAQLYFVPATEKDLEALPLDQMLLSSSPSGVGLGSLRTTWSGGDASWVGIHASNMSNDWDCSHHWHIDSGTFAYESSGYRWAVPA
jgi:hypothetical protein